MKYKGTELSLTKVISDMEEKYGRQRTNNILRNITTKEPLNYFGIMTALQPYINDINEIN